MKCEVTQCGSSELSHTQAAECNCQTADGEVPAPVAT